ncbi:ACP S-malonyltransferase [Lactiplantibacillus plantarum]|uniref:ACP S-malonyltransferase n=1 Tax=Lactiplantibacillus plantarum TaxID=1590 RepID=UPI0021F6BFD3|nr:ACP S-malonyltransferase [Lactiplantibacillus plantarum]MCW0154568.1 ACP S-malonyltransferase [Lactiplantibacillus plantarum]
MAKTAYLFAGQGAQTLGMGQDLYREEPSYRQTVTQASDILGINLADPEVAAAPENTQVAILTMSYGIWRLIAPTAATPVGLVGLSLGEYSALVAAGSLSFEDGLRLVADRSRYMAAAGHETPGKMAAVLTDQQTIVQELCDKIDGVYIANYNTLNQLVVGGTPEAVKQLKQALKDHKIRVVPLKVAVSSHTPLMASASEKLGQRLETVAFTAPKWTVWSNTTGQPFAVEHLAATLVDQLVAPTHFYDDFRGLTAAGADQFVEIGPGHVLSGFAKQIAPAAKRYQINDMTTLNAVRSELGW